MRWVLSLCLATATLIGGISLLPGIETATADTIILKCTTSDGQPVYGGVKIDLQRKEITWGGFAYPNYKIIRTTDRYITAIESAETMIKDVGSEVFVFDRVSGECKQAGIAMICYSPPIAGSIECASGFKLTAYTYLGRCARPLL